MIIKKFKINDMHCSSCALTIDMDLEDLDGVVSSKTSYAKAETELELDSDKVTDEKILGVIKKAGYSAKPLDS